MATPLIEDIADTAFWVAHYRAEETQRADALFQDPLAARLAGERGRRIAQNMPRAQYTRWSVVSRTVVIDRYVREAISSGVNTVINLGAGLDTRPYRLDLPAHVNWVEIDHPKIIEYKQEKLGDQAPHCTLRRVGLDLSQRRARTQLFSELNTQSPRSLLITEGVIPYLTPEQVAELADDLHAQPHFELWVAEYYAREVYPHLQKSRSFNEQMKNSPFRFFPEDWHGLFAAHGWRERQMLYLGEESYELGRSMPLPWWARLLVRLAPEARRRASQRFVGYALLQRG